ncbi:hypothetical protein FJV41_23835 [Myxococcus llanfairpwllgwyngyllgogerychwyrndrobwllllantysiliogogogochensis]|uniref:Uncharacterized protein n=1 Tax=Myxococcus llanfairpwllgwyngyllgogerychwyrndrobwllllantysiliogogogochensis TaxID=2590453 RepID=A0A540WYC2_9BACT|nr:hypothetical protein [Myxococcus llanfairpwllgwyngyllgogerychwyrndrobwllllantysiliogogogochensis]TQF13424.1 hypothetical protein FJV41_23835 [Myxococcus llanfairpwllgwyngyllgogerychwyrndrobwllllantysiliogogogochensis]
MATPLDLISTVQQLLQALARLEELAAQCPALSGILAELHSVTSQARHDLESIAAGAGILMARSPAQAGCSNVAGTVRVLTEAAELVQALHAGLPTRRATITLFPHRSSSQTHL